MCSLLAVLAAHAAPSGDASLPSPSDVTAWSAAQAAGPPDTLSAGDHPTAWASATPDGGPEWLELTYPRAVSVERIRIVETHNPGAVIRVVGLLPSGGEVGLWEGHVPMRNAPAILDIRISEPLITDRIRLELDTSLVSGWNEIDAVELLGTDGSGQWAQAATASSTFGQPQPPLPDPLAHLIGSRVTAHIAGQIIEGTLIAIDGQMLQIRSPTQDHAVSRRWLQLLQWEPSEPLSP